MVSRWPADRLGGSSGWRHRDIHGRRCRWEDVSPAWSQLVRLVDHVRTAVAASAGYDGQFSWSSDGRRLAFISDRDGYDAVYVTDVTGAHVRRVTTTASLNPEWEP